MPRVGRLLASGLILLAVLAGVLSADVHDADSQAASLHLNRAQILESQGTGFTRPQSFIAPHTLAENWTDVYLPHVPRSQLLVAAAQTKDGALPTAITWYRIQVPDLERVPAPRDLYIPRWKSDGQISIYADARLIYQSHGNLLWNGSNHPLWIALDDSADAVPPRVILIRIQHLRGTGGALSSIWVGNQAALGWRYHTREWLQGQLPLMSSAAYLAAGIFAFFVWLRRRHERLYLLFFAMSVAAYIRTLHYYIGLEPLAISDAWFGWLTVNSVFWLVAFSHLFLVRLHQRSQPWLTRVVVGVAAASGFLTLPLVSLFPNATLISPATYIALLIVGNTAFVVGLRNSWLSRSREGLVVAGFSVLNLQFGAYDWLLMNNLADIESAYLAPYTNITAYFIFASIMYGRYVSAIRDVEQINARLEQRLRAREAELAESYARLREVEHRQILNQERQRLMQDMHDGLGSSLVSALRVVEGGRSSEVEVAQVLEGCIDDLKLTIDSMEPVEADLLLLLATLRYRLQPRLEGPGMLLRWEIEDVPPLDWLDPQNALHIQRILQEAFTNIIKHTRATEIRLATGTQADGVVVTIADNGPGFELQKALRGGGKGLSNQMRRAQAIGAEIRWHSDATGTRLTLWLPLIRGPAQNRGAVKAEPV